MSWTSDARGKSTRGNDEGTRSQDVFTAYNLQCFGSDSTPQAPCKIAVHLMINAFEKPRCKRHHSLRTSSRISSPYRSIPCSIILPIRRRSIALIPHRLLPLPLLRLLLVPALLQTHPKNHLLRARTAGTLSRASPARPPPNDPQAPVSRFSVADAASATKGPTQTLTP